MREKQRIKKEKRHEIQAEPRRSQSGVIRKLYYTTKTNRNPRWRKYSQKQDLKQTAPAGEGQKQRKFKR